MRWIHVFFGIDPIDASIDTQNKIGVDTLGIDLSTSMQNYFELYGF